MKKTTTPKKQPKPVKKPSLLSVDNLKAVYGGKGVVIR